MFSFIQLLCVPLFVNKETNSITEDTVFFKSFLTVILGVDCGLADYMVSRRFSNSKCHIQT